jgi:hypothetical protein
VRVVAPQFSPQQPDFKGGEST